MPCRLFSCFRPGSLFGLPRMGAPLGSCPRFVLLYLLHKRKQFRFKTVMEETWMSAPGQFYLYYLYESSIPWHRILVVNAWGFHVVLDPCWRVAQRKHHFPLEPKFQNIFHGSILRTVGVFLYLLGKRLWHTHSETSMCEAVGMPRGKHIQTQTPRCSRLRGKTNTVRWLQVGWHSEQ